MAMSQSLAKNLVHPRLGPKSGGQTGGLGGRATATASFEAGSREVWLEGVEAAGEAKVGLMNERREEIVKMMKQKKGISTTFRFMIGACTNPGESKKQVIDTIVSRDSWTQYEDARK